MRISPRSIPAFLAVLLTVTMLSLPATAQDDIYDYDLKDNGTTVETIKLGNTTYRTTTTYDGTVYESSRTQIGSTTYYEGSSSDGWSYDGSSVDVGSMSFSDTDYYDASGAFTGSSSTTTYRNGLGSTTYYEGFDGTDYSTGSTSTYDYDLNFDY